MLTKQDMVISVSIVCQQVLQELKDKALKRAGLVEAHVLLLIQERAMARRNKDYLKSDQIRDELARKGITLIDIGSDTIWRPYHVGQH